MFNKDLNSMGPFAFYSLCGLTFQPNFEQNLSSQMKSRGKK